MCSMRLVGNTKRKNYGEKITICVPLRNFVELHLHNWGTYWQWEKLVKHQYLPQVSCTIWWPQTTKMGSADCGTTANFIRFHMIILLLQRRRSLQANQTLYNVWPSHGLVNYIYLWGLLLTDRMLPGAEFTLCPSLAFSYIGSITATSQKFMTSYKEWNYGTLAEGTMCIWLGGHHVGRQPTF